ncbi:MAG: hypothetical protein ABIG88_01265 [Patescibacteria group bacterium]|nr:hypothetical protein [Patescibacteria group bacterium]
MNILATILGIFIVLSMFSLIIYLAVKKKVWLIMIIGGVLVIGIIFILINSSEKPKITNKTSTSTAQQKPRASRTLSATFKLPADGTIVSRDENGREISYKKGQYVRFEQLTASGKFVYVNPDSPSWETNKRSCISGPASSDGTIKLMSCSGREMSLRVTVQ